MMIRISDPELMPALVAHLRQSEFAVEVLDAQTLEAHLPRATQPRSTSQSLKALVVEASSPASDDGRRQLERLGDLEVALALRRVEDQPRALDFTVRSRVARRHVLELDPLVSDQDDLRGNANRWFAEGDITPCMK
jgi:hypothetical protein